VTFFNYTMYILARYTLYPYNIVHVDIVIDLLIM
jgi:hypothetical protein